MPKKKTKKAATKRFKLTGRGKVRRGKAYKSHILTKKSPKRKRHLRKNTVASRADNVRIAHLLSA
ncbi:MAG TPA: 50S ribosomal protein L35 [Gemmatimonadales bacterium]|jgi:large subunit ribosomal protein L35